MEKELQVKLCFEYLTILSKGRLKPDKNKVHGHIRESLDNCDDIKACKNKINELLEIKQTTYDSNNRNSTTG